MKQLRSFFAARKRLLIFTGLLTIAAHGSPSALASTKVLPGSTRAKHEVPMLTIDELIKAGWNAPRPPYPFGSRSRKEEGTVYVELVTDASGNVIKARALPKSVNFPELRKQLVGMALGRWHGPPNTRVITSMTFQLH